MIKHSSPHVLYLNTVLTNLIRLNIYSFVLLAFNLAYSLDTKEHRKVSTRLIWLFLLPAKQSKITMLWLLSDPTNNYHPCICTFHQLCGLFFIVFQLIVLDLNWTQFLKIIQLGLQSQQNGLFGRGLLKETETFRQRINRGAAVMDNFRQIMGFMIILIRLSCRHPGQKNLKHSKHPCSCWGFSILLKDTSAGWTLESGNHVFESDKILFTHQAGPALPLHNVLPFLQLEKCQARVDSFSYSGLPHFLGDSCWAGTCASSS